jgi:hypothetical protein
VVARRRRREAEVRHGGGNVARVTAARREQGGGVGAASRHGASDGGVGWRERWRRERCKMGLRLEPVRDLVEDKKMGIGHGSGWR